MADNGRAPSGQAGRASHGDAVELAAPPSGDHPSRDECGCPYGLTDDRATVWLDGYQAALRWVRETMQ